MLKAACKHDDDDDDDDDDALRHILFIITAQISI